MLWTRPTFAIVASVKWNLTITWSTQSITTRAWNSNEVRARKEISRIWWHCGICGRLRTALTQAAASSSALTDLGSGWCAWLLPVYLLSRSRARAIGAASVTPGGGGGGGSNPRLPRRGRRTSPLCGRAACSSCTKNVIWRWLRRT